MKPRKPLNTQPLACTYARVSLEQQTDNFSLPSQRRAMLKLASEKNYHVPPEYEFVDGGALGGESDRPAFVKMRELVRAGQVKALIVFDPDRLARGLALMMIVEEECERHNVALEFVTMPADRSAEGKMTRQMRAVFSEYEKMKFRERSSRGRREKLMAGFVTSGRVAYGYNYLGRRVGKRGELAVNPDEAKIVKRIFKEADQGVKLLDICRRLTEDGVPTQTGAPWSKPVISQMLRNTSYVGEARCNRRMVAEPATRRKPTVPGKSKKTSMRARPESDWIIVKVPGIVDKKLFDRVQARLQRDRHINSGRPSPYILRGLLRCGVCSFACTVQTNHGAPRYRCNHIDRLSYGRLCQQPSVSVPKIEAVVWDEMIRTFEDPARLWELMNDHWATLARTDKQTARERADLERTIAKIKQREFRAAQAMIDADLTDSRQTFRDALKEMQSQRRAAESRLAQLQPAQQPGFNIEKYCEKVDVWRKAKAPEQRREILRKVVERVDLKDGNVAIHFRFGGIPGTNCISHESDAGPGQRS